MTTTHGYAPDSMPVSEGLIVKNRTYNLSRGYDAGNRLTSWNRTGNVAVGSRQTEAWAYDNAGNQTSVTRDGTADARTYNDDNELVSTTEGNTTRDAKGNITEDAEGNEYKYDLDNRIYEIKMDGGDTIELAYDAMSRRVFRKNGSDEKAFLWWGDQETSEHISGAGQPVIQNDLWAHPTALNKIVARAVEGKKTDIQYYHKNYLDHVYAVSDKDGDIKEHYRYTAFGEAEIYNTQGQKLAESAIDNDVLWNSRRFDGDTGLYYYKYRHYAAKLGRWLGRDPIEEAGGINLYAFVGNRPLNWWDFLGEDAEIKEGDDNKKGGEPTLTAKEILWNLGTCGSFVWGVRFSVSPDKEETGIILQEVEIDISYQKYDGSGNLLEEVIKDEPEVNPYHEIWNASNDHRFTFGELEDYFYYRMIANPLTGKFADGGGISNSKSVTATITGYARYYPDLEFDEQTGKLANKGWKKKNPKTWAKDLWSGKDNPGWLKAGNSHSNLLTHTVTVKWDCCQEVSNTELVSKSIK